MRLKGIFQAKNRLISLVLIVFFGILASLGLITFLQYWQDNEETSLRKEWGMALALQIKSEILGSTQVVNSLKNLILSSENFRQDVFDVFVSSSLFRYPSVTGIYWAKGAVDETGKESLQLEMEYSSQGHHLRLEDLLDTSKGQSLIDLSKRSQRMLLTPGALLNNNSTYTALLPVSGVDDGRFQYMQGLVVANFDFTENFRHIFASKAQQVSSVRISDVTLPSLPQVLFSQNWEEQQTNVLSTSIAVAGRVLDFSYVLTSSGSHNVIWGSVILLGMLATGLMLLLTSRTWKYEQALEETVVRRTQELVQRNLLYSSFLSTTSEAFLVLDEQGFVINSNERADKLFSSENVSCRSKHISQFLVEESFKQLFLDDRNDQVCVPKQIYNSLEIEGICGHGQRIPLKVKIAEVYDNEDTKWIVLARDISVRRQAEERLKRSERQFRQAFLLGSLPIAIINNNGEIKDSNKAFQRFVGYEANEVYGRKLKEFFHPDGLKPFLDWMKAAVTGKSENFQCDQRLINRASYSLWAIASYTAVYEFGGKLNSVICQYHDYTEQRYAQEELRRNRDKLAELVEQRTKEARDARESLIASINAADNAIFVFDNENNLEFSSEHASNLFPEIKDKMKPGISAANLFEMMSASTGDDPEGRRQRLSRLIKGEGGVEFRLTNGRWIQTGVRKTPSGGTIVVYTDVSTYKIQEEKLQHQATELAKSLKVQQEVNEQQRMFVSVVSHEFKTPLAIIDSAAQRILRRGDKMPEEELHNRLHRIRAAVTRLLNLLKGTLRVESFENARLDFSPKRQNIVPVIEKICQRHAELTGAQEIFFDKPQNDVSVYVDSQLLELALDNLLNNAQKYSPSDMPVHVSLDCEEQRLLINVCDRGDGIASTEIEHIFERFYRSTSVSHIEGTGVGLAIVKQIMELHGGNAGVFTTPGEGSRFYLAFPLSAALHDEGV
ncbi:MAG: PAS domain S-box protein [Methylocystaceae bacterium]|nr:PAS domain S-box protein [Methylocystaceae bacterium]